MAAFGLWLSCVGVNSVIGEKRFTFGLLELQDGIDLVPVMTGIFAVTEIIAWIQERGTISKLGRLEGSVWKGVIRHLPLSGGADPLDLGRRLIGIVPGVGAVTA